MSCFLRIPPKTNLLAEIKIDLFFALTTTSSHTVSFCRLARFILLKGKLKVYGTSKLNFIALQLYENVGYVSRSIVYYSPVALVFPRVLTHREVLPLPRNVKG